MPVYYSTVYCMPTLRRCALYKFTYLLTDHYSQITFTPHIRENMSKMISAVLYVH